MIVLISRKWDLILTVQNSPMKLSSVEKNVHNPPITFNNVPVKCVQCYKHLALAIKVPWAYFLNFVKSQ